MHRIDLRQHFFLDFAVCSVVGVIFFDTSVRLAEAYLCDVGVSVISPAVPIPWYAVAHQSGLLCHVVTLESTTRKKSQ